MSRSRFRKLSLLPLLAATMLVLVGPAEVLLREAFSTGRAEAGMLVWILVFTLALPLWIFAAAVAGALARRRPHPHIVPPAGVKIPWKGQ
jgi:ABC-type transport system involved in cytochrome c biogenesis permease component